MNVRVRFPLFPLQFKYHWLELYYRFAYFSLSIVLTYMIIYNNSYKFLHLFSNSSYIYTYISEAMISIIILTFYLTWLALTPYIIFNIYQYMVSGLYTFESKKLKLILLKIIAVLFLSQLIYIYILLPGATEIIISLTTSEIINYIPKISEYTTFLIKLSLNSNIFFFLPIIIIWILFRFPVIFYSFSKYRAVFLFCISCILSIITPADIGIYIILAIITWWTIELLILSYCICYQWYK